MIGDKKRRKQSHDRMVVDENEVYKFNKYYFRVKKGQYDEFLRKKPWFFSNILIFWIEIRGVPRNFIKQGNSR